MATQKKWRLSGDYFENCNCDVLCPCLVSTGAPLTARPSRGTCDVAIAFHIDRGDYDGVPLDGLNVAVVAHAPGPMAEGNMTLAAYVDERADDRQAAAIEAIFSGAEGGPMAAFAPLVGKHLGARKVPIRYSVQGRRRSAEIPGVMSMAVEPIPTLHASGEAWLAGGHPIAPDRMALAVGGRAAPSPTTACAGATRAGTATTPRSAGRTDRGPRRPPNRAPTRRRAAAGAGRPRP